MIPDDYRQAHSDVDGCLSDLKGLVHALDGITMESPAINCTTNDALSINVLVRSIQEVIERAENHQEEAWKAVADRLHPRSKTEGAQ